MWFMGTPPNPIHPARSRPALSKRFEELFEEERCGALGFHQLTLWLPFSHPCIFIHPLTTHPPPPSHASIHLHQQLAFPSLRTEYSKRFSPSSSSSSSSCFAAKLACLVRDGAMNGSQRRRTEFGIRQSGLPSQPRVLVRRIVICVRRGSKGKICAAHRESR